MITGDGLNDSFTGLLALVPSGQKIDKNAGAYALEDLDAVIDLVKDKDGQCDWLMMSARSIRSYYGLLRALGGASISEVVTLPSGRQVPTYRGIPIFRNDYIPTDGGGGTETTIFAGTFDDGSGKHGISGLTAMGAAGVRVTEVGESETKDETITRVKMYASFALFSELGIAAAVAVTN